MVGAAGHIGKHIFAALHERTTATSPILVITRTSSSSADAIPPSPNVKIAKVEDYKNVEEVAAILRAHHIEVLVSAANWQTEEGICAEEMALVDAARAADVKLFVPSEFGVSSVDAPTGLWKAKDDVASELQMLYLSGVIYNTTDRAYERDRIALCEILREYHCFDIKIC